mmetsp:Transcript_18333/g.29396  ORF Transcript_18333/g.29396 Transcript_18333/m.29396 type:complete len:369 (+) Transcript_18333:4174-5280(+)
MRMIRPMQNDQRFAQRRGKARVKSRIPLFVLIAKTHHHNVRIRDPLAGADRVDHRTLVVMPILVVFGPQDRNAAIITGRVIGHRPRKRQIQTLRPFHDLLAPIRVDFARKVNVQCHSRLLHPLCHNLHPPLPKARSDAPCHHKMIGRAHRIIAGLHNLETRICDLLINPCDALERDKWCFADPLQHRKHPFDQAEFPAQRPLCQTGCFRDEHTIRCQQFVNTGKGAWLIAHQMEQVKTHDDIKTTGHQGGVKNVCGDKPHIVRPLSRLGLGNHARRKVSGHDLARIRREAQGRAACATAKFKDSGLRRQIGLHPLHRLVIGGFVKNGSGGVFNGDLVPKSTLRFHCVSPSSAHINRRVKDVYPLNLLL